MKTENNFANTAETFKQNVAKNIKWMQDTNAKLLEIRKQQIKTTSDLFNNDVTTSQMESIDLFITSCFPDSSEAFTELFQKGIDISANLLETNMKQFTELSENVSLPDEIKRQAESLQKQLADLTKLNQINFDTVLKQIGSTTKSFSPLSEQLKSKMDTVAASNKEIIQKIIESYTPISKIENGAFDVLNNQIKEGLNNNIKFWFDIINSANKPLGTINENPDNNLLKGSSENTIEKKNLSVISHNHQ